MKKRQPPYSKNQRRHSVHFTSLDYNPEAIQRIGLTPNVGTALGWEASQ